MAPMPMHGTFVMRAHNNNVCATSKHHSAQHHKVLINQHPVSAYIGFRMFCLIVCDMRFYVLWNMQPIWVNPLADGGGGGGVGTP